MRIAVLAAAALALSACATVEKLDAANDVHALLVSIRDNDTATFDAHVDRRALKREIQARLVAEGRRDPRFSGIAAALAPGLAELAGETLVQPQVFRLVAERYGYTPQTKIPNPVVISQALKPLPDGRVCATRSKGGPCLLTFTKVEGTWKLTGFEGGLSELRI
ncbi:DUF2939 domain-containing protein [Phenylobacterium sp.]|jgi:hypothetical protein|uniref:DUF2939 domain-containing protein n=1 Tax=Phenylobacterium sp. TaxID=1871053 RepID=UPI002F9323AF